MSAPLATVGARRPHVVTVVGAGAGNLKATVAINLAAALCGLGRRVALCDDEGAAAAALGARAPARVTLPRAPGRRAADGGPAAPAPALALLRGGAGADAWPADADVVLVDPPARLGERTLGAIAAADLVLVPVDASPLALRALREVAHVARLAEPAPRLRVALARLLPRGADRWALVERVEDAAPEALVHATLPMARAARAGAAVRPLLYAPGTRAAAAYAGLAAELLAALRTPGPAPALAR